MGFFGDFYPGDRGFFSIWGFISPGFLSPGFPDFRKSGDFYLRDLGFLKSGDFYPRGSRIFENLGIFIPGDRSF